MKIANDLKNILPDLLWVGLAKATEFNQTTSVNLHYFEPNTWYLNMADEFGRFSNAIIIRKKDDSINMFMKYWISIFGAPNWSFGDNEGEFMSDFYDISRKFHTTVSGAGSFTPWSTSTCKKQSSCKLLKIRDKSIVAMIPH